MKLITIFPLYCSVHNQANLRLEFPVESQEVWSANDFTCGTFHTNTYFGINWRIFYINIYIQEMRMNGSKRISYWLVSLWSSSCVLSNKNFPNVHHIRAQVNVFLMTSIFDSLLPSSGESLKVCTSLGFHWFWTPTWHLKCNLLLVKMCLFAFFLHTSRVKKQRIKSGRTYHTLKRYRGNCKIKNH